MIKILRILVLVPLISFSQTERVIVNYTSLLLDANDIYGSFLYENGQLISTKDESIYTETSLDTIVNLNNLGEVYTFGNHYKFTYYKKLNSDFLIQDRSFGMKKLIKDENYKIKWEITGLTKNILNYECQEAVGTFRGREYRAYFLKDISISSGPFKFDGLPGIILEVLSTDGSVKITAKNITYDEGDISNPFSNVSTSNWLEFLMFYKSKYEKSKTLWDNGYEIYIPKRYIEIFIN